MFEQLHKDTIKLNWRLSQSIAIFETILIFFFRAMLGDFGLRRLKSLWEQEMRIYLPDIGTAPDWSPWAPSSVQVRKKKKRNNEIQYK